MNALYRPGPMEYIPKYINRKFGREKIVYDLPVMEKYLKDTYGITVYQEQVMLLSQLLADFTRGEADSLRKAMGKKIEKDMAKLKPKFFDGCKKNGHDLQVVNKIWKDWEAFANYAFNKSHSTCYAYVAYRMAYLKAHYPGEFMAAVLSRNLTDLKEITNFLDECNRMHLRVLGPDINESELKFVVNKRGEIRFGMAGIKNVGEGAVNSILEERRTNGPYTSIFDLARRITSHQVNRRCLESLAQAGAFDCFEGSHRAQYFYKGPGDETSFLEKVLRHATEFNIRKNSAQQSLFGETEEVTFTELELPACEAMSKLEQLRLEKEITGFYISGHPLDDYRQELDSFCNVTIESLKSDLRRFRNMDIYFGGIVTGSQHKTGKNGKPFGSFVIEDYFDSINLFLYSEDYLKYKHLLDDGTYLFVKARIENRYDSPDQLVVRVNGMTLLTEVMEKMTKGLVVTVPLDLLTADTIEQIHDMAKKHKGKAQLKLKVEDAGEKISIELPSRKFRVNPKAMVTAISEFPGLEYKIIHD
jgi:DNA polymerase-3 subunit alpha